MSTIVAVKKNGTVSIGADTLTKLGCTKESAEYVKNHSKIIKVSSNYIATVGHASGGFVLSGYFHKQKKVFLNSTEEIFEESLRLHESLKKMYFLNPRENENDKFESLRRDSLIANSYGIFGLNALRSVREYTKFTSFGSGAQFALGAMKAIYDQTDSSEAIARIGLEAAVEFDSNTGSPLEIHSIKLKEEK